MRDLPSWNRLVCVGQATCDTIVNVRGTVPLGDQGLGTVTRQSGGTAAIVARAAAMLDVVEVVFTGHAGEDAGGEAAVAELEAAGVAVGRLVTTARSPEVV